MAVTVTSGDIDLVLVVDTFLLLLIGIGPKIALVPFVEVTASMDTRTKRAVTRKMLVTAAVAALFLVIFGGILTRLLHFSPEALAVAGGIILLIISITMVLSPGDSESREHAMDGKDPMQLAVFPLAVPYLLNPVGIIVLVTLSAEAGTLGRSVLVIGLLALVLILDIVVFRWANRVSEHLDPSRMLLTEKVFGFLIAAIAVQFILQGLADLGVIHLNAH